MTEQPPERPEFPQNRPIQNQDPSTPQHAVEREQMLPSDVPQHTPWVTYSILALTVLVFLAQIGSDAIYGFDLPASFGMKVNDLIAQGQFWRLFTPMLLHGSILHIGFNMYALFVIGPELERHFGRTRYLLLYVLSGFAGNVFSMAFTAQNSLGASTSIFGLLAAQGVFVYQNRELFGARSKQVLNRVLYLAFINLVIGLQEGIDNWGHVGGLLGGLAFTWLAGPLLTLQSTPPRFRLVDRRPESAALSAALAVGIVFGSIVLVLIFFRG